ncbi:hypothetical protein WDZ17_01040 [Pseudokineococcus basanitobsidens]|uniref:Pyridine nucleotide-disulfide oxidoreductase n=1 Tax=Pseudokineococcus basanitobsidens TaxID=1926649 RepID=A0ABU8RFW8_9ACTN
MPLSPQDALVDTAEVLVVGGGDAGISSAARLLRDGWHDVVLVEPSPVHRYRPLLKDVGAGEASMRSLERPMGPVVPTAAGRSRTPSPRSTRRRTS